MKKPILTILAACALLGSPAWSQSVDPSWTKLLQASEAYTNDAGVGTIESLLPLMPDRWNDPLEHEYAGFLDAMGRGAISSGDAEAKLLKFIESHPNSAYLSYAQMRLGEYYFIRKNYRSAAYWLRQYDPTVFSDEREQRSDYYLAFALMREGDVNEALHRFKALMASPIYTREATFYTGYLLMRTGEVDEALPILKRVEGDSKFGIYAQAFMAEGLLSQRKYSQALTMVEKAMQDPSISPEVKESLQRSGGLAASLLGRKELAVRYLTDYMSTATKPGRVELLTLGKSLFDLGRHRDAVNYLHRVADGGPDFMAQLALYYEGLVQLSLKNADAAQEAFERGLRMNAYPPLTEALSFNNALAAYSRHVGKLGRGTTLLEDHLNRYHAGSDYAAQVVKYLSDAYLNHPDAAASLASMGRISPLPKSLVPIRERVKLRGANRLLGSGKTDEAYRQYDDIIRAGSDARSVAEAYFWKGEVAYRNGDYREAIDATNRYLRQKSSDLPLNPNAYYNLGYAYFSLSDWENARKSFLQFLQSKESPTPDDKTMTFNRLGDIAVQSRDYNGALEYYNRVLQSAGKEADYALFKKGMTYGLMKNYREKAETLASLSGRYPSSDYIPEALYEQGRALSLLSDVSAASVVFRRVFETYSTHPVAPKAGVQLALTYFNAGRMQDAANIYEQVVRKYPRTPEAKTAMQDLKSISIELNRIDQYSKLASEVGMSGAITASEADSLAYLAAERVVASGSSSDARAALEGYLSKYPNGAFAKRAAYSQALLLHNDSKYAEAIESIDRLLPSISDYSLKVDALKLKASSLDRSNRPGEAAETYVTLAHLFNDETLRSEAIISATDRAVKSSSSDFLLSMANDIRSGSLAVKDNAKAKVYGEAADLLARSNRKADAVALSQEILRLPNPGTYMARAEVILALDDFDRGDLSSARTRLQRVIDKGTTDTYWLARAFILLSDIYVKQGDKATAKTYLESVRSNYKNANDGILRMIRERLSKL